MAPVRAVIGLGNPGGEYEGTRHNLGFAVVEAAAEKVGIGFREGKGDFLIGRGQVANEAFALIKPTAYMNNSGIAVGQILEQYELDLNQLLIVVDDFQLPLGKLRLRVRGSAGGHNGLYSVIYHLQSEEFPRLRCGIASPAMPADKQQLAEFVLSPFVENERDTVKRMINAARDTVLAAVADGIGSAIQRFNNQQV